MGCSEVCIELPAIGTMGPIQTLGTECAYGSGGDGEGEGGDGGTDGNVGGHNSQAVIGEYADPPRYINHMLVGPEYVANIGPAFDSMLTELGMLKIGVGHLKKNTNSQINLLADIDSDTSHIYSTLGQIQNEAIKLGADLDNDLNAVLGSLGAIVRNTSNGDSNNGGSGGNPSGDIASIKSMMQYNSSTLGSISGNTNSMDSNLRSMSGQVGSISGTLQSLNSMQSSQLGQMTGSLAAIKGMMQSQLPNNGGGDGNPSSSIDIDYSKMPGSPDNHLNVEQALYSRGCLPGECFDQVSILQQLEGRKAELVALHKTIGEEVTGIFKYDFSGSADVPKCFDLFSYNGTSYDVCIDSGEYWNALAALLMFIFYFVALMIIFRR